MLSWDLHLSQLHKSLSTASFRGDSDILSGLLPFTAQTYHNALAQTDLSAKLIATVQQT